MTITREDPAPLRAQVTSARIATGLAVVVTVAAAAGVLRYGTDLVSFAREQGLRSSLIATWTLPAAVTAVALPAIWTLAAVRSLRRMLHRYRLAADYERRLDDPHSAASVPPLGSHLIQPNRTSAGRAALGLALSVGVAVLLALFATGVGADEFGVTVPQQARTAAGLAAAVAAVVGLALLRSLRAALRRTQVERLSAADLPKQSRAEAGGPRGASRVPMLNVRFAGPLRPAPAPGACPRLLYLRLFDNLAGTEKFVTRWRRFGVVHYLRSADQVSAADLRNLRNADGSVFIDDDHDLERFLAGAEPRPGARRHPVRALLCHGSYWQRAVIRLLQQVDLVVLDLTGFHPGHGGTAFELQASLDLVELSRLRLLAAPDSDRKYLAAQLRRAWTAMAAGSPNAGAESRTITVHLG